jgi:hypothetical protein
MIMIIVVINMLCKNINSNYYIFVFSEELWAKLNGRFSIIAATDSRITCRC